MSFMNKIVLITGAASGNGETIALHFAKASARLSLFDIDFDKLNKVAEKCENLSKTKVFKVYVDVSKDVDLKEAVNSTIREYGKIDILVNCAKIKKSNGIENFDILDDYDRIVNVNLRSVVAIIRFAAEALKESRGCVINVSSVLGQRINSHGLAYNISEAAVVHLTKCVALELADKGVRVNCISPGIVKRDIALNDGTREDDKTIVSYIKSLPLKHTVKAEEIAELVAYVASDKANSITGANFLVDSGFTLTSL
ncbi:3-oxoacyl-[acyl-carrier-protein] reductase FabG-like [Nymphalis io]|uniref:3-oxoacyl-[acyl-carrier-protein] reductase FabG-like n=1 Tax=Inachis io TaxID=171585 RepID=UPI0021685095|nr:3-oxoacyl-[acyl-carrier-protein] reductase FabG-like [Nymphalis io]